MIHLKVTVILIKKVNFYTLIFYVLLLPFAKSNQLITTIILIENLCKEICLQNFYLMIRNGQNLQTQKKTEKWGPHNLILVGLGQDH